MQAVSTAYRPSQIDDALPGEPPAKAKILPDCSKCGCGFADRVTGVPKIKYLCGYCRPKYRHAKIKPR